MKRALPLLLALLLLLGGCAGSPAQSAGGPAVTGHMELRYADQFAVDYYEGGCALLTIGGADRFLIVPEGTEAPAELAECAVVIPQGTEHIYLAASSAMDLFLGLGALDTVRLTSTARNNWSLERVRDALDAGELLYAGKYSAPDYELLLAEDCGLAIESTMIYHSPAIKEKLEGLGIPVLVERSSYESHPMGRVEWIKVYGLLTGRTEEAEAFFERQLELLEGLEEAGSTGRTVAFFYINSQGGVVVRKSGDYVARMIEMAGGQYVFSDLAGEEENALSTLTIGMEDFYAAARDADILIYNSSIDGDIADMEQLLDKSALLADFKAVREGNVWCTGKNMFQETSASAGVIADLHAVIAGEAAGDELAYMHRVK